MRSSSKFFKIVTGITLTSTLLLLSGCSIFDGEPNQTPEPENTIPVDVRVQVYNPLTPPISTPMNEVSYDNGIKMDVMFTGLGYPTPEEYETLTGQKDTGTTTLVSTARIIGVSLVATNTTSSPIALDTLTWSAPSLDGKETSWMQSATSLPALAGYTLNPVMLSPGDDIQPGATINWSFIVLLPTVNWNSEKVNYTQTLSAPSWGEKNISFNFETVEPTKTNINTPEGTEIYDKEKDNQQKTDDE